MIAADLPPARVPYGDVRLGVLVAHRVFPTNPCNGHEQVQTSLSPPAWARTSEEKGQLLGAANLAGRRCLIWVRGHLDRATTCKVVAHELNHWNGAVDGDPSQPLMSSNGVVVYVGSERGHADFWSFPPCEVP